jgi:hypothetical protein
VHRAEELETRDFHELHRPVARHSSPHRPSSVVHSTFVVHFVASVVPLVVFDALEASVQVGLNVEPTPKAVPEVFAVASFGRQIWVENCSKA